MRIAILLVTASVLALLAACGGDSSSSSTPTDTGASSSSSPTPTPTFNANAPGAQTVNAAACTAQDLQGTFVSSQGAAGHVYLTLEAGHASRACTLPGPPELRWYDAAGNGLGVPFTPVADCSSSQTDYTTCVYADPVGMAPSGATSAVRATVGIVNIGALQPCASAPLKGHTVGLQFPDTPLDVQIPLPEDIALQTCSAQVTLEGYGPRS